jgi:hypothetical protein
MATRPQEHPDADLLADLAADVLPQDLARRVETHVVDCDRCAGLLAEAEGIRGLLRRELPPAMPEDVADRIGAAIAALRLGPAAGERIGLDDDPEADARWAEAAASGAVGAARGRRTLGEDSPGEAPGSWVAKRKAGRPGSVTRLRRAASGPARQRRQALEEQRSAERTGRIGRVLLAAAAVVVFVAAGGVAVRLLGDAGVVPTAASNADSGDSGDSLASGGDEERAATAPESGGTGGSLSGTGERSSAADGEAPVVATGTDYTAAGLEAQARLLVATAGATMYLGGDAKATPGKPAPSPQASPQLPAAGPPAGNQALKTPAALRACLQALDVADEQVVAVDLARYEGRDSAVIVLRASGGAYDVWVVARDCRPGADGALKYVPMTP